MRDEARPWCLVTIVDVEGSSYRRPGTRMIVTEDGRRTGAVSGGCLEAEVAEHALHAIETGRPSLVVLNDDLDPSSDNFGTGCNGRIRVLLEPLPGHFNPLDGLMDLLRRRMGCVMATTVVASASGSVEVERLLVWRDGTQDLTRLPRVDRLRSRVRAAATNALARRRTEIVSLTEDDSVRALLEFVEPPLRLVIVGDGYDVGPVVRLAAHLGWEAVVVGRREREALKADFPEASEHIHTMHAEDVARLCRTDAETAVVLMSHNFERDRIGLLDFLATPCFYLGVLGPAQRSERMGAAADERVHGPVGLDVGAETPAEIALSLIAEVQAAYRGRRGGKLRARNGPIHEPITIVTPPRRDTEPVRE